MSLVFSLALASSPLFSWADSLYLDVPRLGTVEEYSSSGRTAHWIYADIAVLERNSRGRWSMGLRPVSPGLQSRIDNIVMNAAIDSVEQGDLEPVKWFCVEGVLYEAQYHTGPWAEIEHVLAEVTPSYTVDVRNSAVGSGSRAVLGALYWGEDPVFRSANSDFELASPPASVDVTDYLAAVADDREIGIDQVNLTGILYLQDDFPLFFYVLGGN